MARPTHQQLAVLLDFLLQNPDIVKGRLYTTSAKQESHRKWSDIATILNAVGGAQKESKGWAKYWKGKQNALKKTYAIYVQTINQTGDRPADISSVFSCIEHRLLKLIRGPQCPTIDYRVDVNPYGSTTQNQNEVQDNIFTLREDNDIGANVSIPHSLCIRNRNTVTTPRRNRNPKNTSTMTQRVRAKITLENERKRLSDIEKLRVEGDSITATAQAEGLITALSEGFQTVANALNNIADALRQRNV